jgi:pyrophosphatase PpaX
MEPKRAAIFDLDGTLFDSMPFVIETFVYAVEPFRPRPTREEVLGHLGGPLETCLRNILGPAVAAAFPAARERLLRYEHGQEGKLPPFAGAAHLLTELSKREIRLGLWTGRDRWSAERMLAAHDFTRFFPAYVCGDDLPSHKPDPAGLFRAIELAGATPAASIFLGDADADVEGGHAAGVHTIFIHHGRAAPAHIHSRAAEVYAHPSEAYSALFRHFGG